MNAYETAKGITLTERQLMMEAWIDKLGLCKVLNEMAEIAEYKAQHVREVWPGENEGIAKAWEREAKNLRANAAKVNLNI